MTKYSGIIFDFNGVLWWDTSLQVQAWRQFAKQQLGIYLTSKEMAVQVHGRNNQHTFEYLMGANLEPDEVRQLSEKKERLYRELCLAQGDGFKLSPGAVGLLDGLAAHKIPRTIATASGEENMDFFFENLYLDRWFARAQIVFDDGSRPGKPDPEIYLQAAKKLGLTPMVCVVVEDSISGIQSAQSAGIGHIIALGSVDQQARLSGLDGVDQVVDNLGNLDLKKVFL
jgi:beta-phosphoglucomutase-like phosphatase (HAD superfamily)